KLFSRVAPPFFGFPPWTPEDGGDIALVGVPLDQGNRTAPGARYGPDAVRQASLLYSSSGRVQDCGQLGGWFEPETDSLVLKGAQVRDAGDIYFDPSDGSEEHWRRITEGVRRLVKSGAVPLMIGGDHSLTFAALRGVDQNPVGFLHL